MPTVGCVPYLNARPLVWGLEPPRGDGAVEVRYDVPSRLPALLESGAAQAILVSSIEALRRPGSRVASNVSISSQEEVLSVRLFSKVPFERIGSLALDQSSMTSNALAQIVLSESYGARPTVERCPPGLGAMLARHDAAVLIGDNGMREQGEGLRILDLGSAWRGMTGLPFVWAVWLGEDGLDAELSSALSVSARRGSEEIEDVIAHLEPIPGIEQSLARTYLTEIMDYTLGPDHVRALETFADFLARYGMVQDPALPEFVAPQGAGVHTGSLEAGP